MKKPVNRIIRTANTTTPKDEVTMTIIDFVIGALFMNAMPHFVLGVWKGRMFSAFGFGNKQNIAYGLSCFFLAMGLFLYKHGADAILGNGIYVGALFILVVYFLTGQIWYKLFKQKGTEA